ncbi:MAG: hypothetical protein CMJ51_07530 [Planctomycetaceae bacterium]|nr:hypothetical protein [Planctomycetaceae bacterium]
MTVIASGELDAGHRPLDDPVRNFKALASGFSKRLHARRRHEGTGRVHSVQRAPSGVVPPSDLGDLDRSEGFHVESDPIIRGLHRLLGHQPSRPQIQKKTQSVDVPPPADVVASAEVRVHEWMAGGVDHEPSRPLHRRLSIGVFTDLQTTKQRSPGDRRSTDAVSDRDHRSTTTAALDQCLGIIRPRCHPIDPLVRPFRLVGSLLSLQQQSNPTGDRGVDRFGIDRRGLDLRNLDLRNLGRFHVDLRSRSRVFDHRGRRWISRWGDEGRSGRGPHRAHRQAEDRRQAPGHGDDGIEFHSESSSVFGM